MAKTWQPARGHDAPQAPTTLTEIARRYVGCAASLAKVMGVPLTEAFMQAYHPAISCCFIESGRAGVRLPDRITLPPLVAPGPQAHGPQGAADRHPVPGHQDGAGEAPGTPPPAMPAVNGHGRLPPEARLTQDQARTLKQLAHVAFGYPEGERRLRADLGFEVDESLTLRHLAAHVRVERYQALRAAYQAARP